MTDWPDFDFLLGKVRRQVRGVARTVHSALGDDPFEVLAHRGFGNGARAYVYGRALEVRNVSVSTDSDSTFRNLLNTYRRADADPLPFARISIECAGRSTPCTADDEGFFTACIDVPLESEDDEWNGYEVSLLAPLRPGVERVTGKGEVLVPPATARFGVISDIDDTVIQSRVSRKASVVVGSPSQGREAPKG
jgi:phosphatidate phosphatase APP1